MAPKIVSKSEEVLQYGYQKPVDLGTWTNIRYAIYDPNKNAFFGRTPRNWAEITAFYAVFFGVLAIGFTICMYGLLSSVSLDRPTYLLERSLIGSNPGMGYRPYPDNVEDQGTVIWYKANDQENLVKWKDLLDKFLNVYHNKSVEGYNNRVTCEGDNPPPPGKVCNVNLEHFGPCNSENFYAYNKSSPCIFIKLNRLYNWVPEYYTKDDIPQELEDEGLRSVISNSTHNAVWINCYGKDSADKDNIGPIEYFPMQGFASHYYPFTNTKGYLSPLVAIHLKRPITGILIEVECRAWAKNIHYVTSKQHAEGSVRLQIMVDQN